MTNHSSDDDEDLQRPVSRGEKKPSKTNGAAFAEVVRATIKANKEEAAATAVERS